jgi:hypothetical protein
LPLVVEIFPRVLTGPVRKNSPSQRERYLGTVPMRPDLGRLAAASEDAFDAAISAVVMTARVDQLQALPDAPGYALEGKIWQPRDPFPARDRRPPASRRLWRPCDHSRCGYSGGAARGESATAQAEQILDMLSVDLVGSRRVQSDRLDDQPDDQAKQPPQAATSLAPAFSHQPARIDPT